MNEENKKSQVEKTLQKATKRLLQLMDQTLVSILLISSL